MSESARRRAGGSGRGDVDAPERGRLSSLLAMPMVSGAYEAEDGVLRLWHPGRAVLDSAAQVKQYFEEIGRLIASCPSPPWLLIDYANVEVRREVTQEYVEKARAYRPLVRDVHRFGVSEATEGVLTRVAILLATGVDANIFPDEASARAALRKVRAARPR